MLMKFRLDTALIIGWLGMGFGWNLAFKVLVRTLSFSVGHKIVVLLILKGDGSERFMIRDLGSLKGCLWFPQQHFSRPLLFVWRFWC